MKQYPVVTGVESVRDAFSNLSKVSPSMLGWKYKVFLYTSECLDNNTMMEIDTEIKTIFKMMGVTSYHVSERVLTPPISTFFDCGDGQGFQFTSSYGYEH